MTKVQNPIIGRAKGSAGGMTFSKNSDQNVMRAKAFEVNNPKTTAQTTQRDYFKTLVALVSTFSPEQLRTLFPNKPKKMSRRNALTRQLSEYVVISGTTKYIYFTDIKTLGNASVMNFGETLLEKNETEMYVSLDESISFDQKYRDYYYVCVFVNESKEQIIFPINSSLVGDNDYHFSYPTNWEQNDEINVIPFITNSKENVSDKGFGSFIIKTRPEKK